MKNIYCKQCIVLQASCSALKLYNVDEAFEVRKWWDLLGWYHWQANVIMMTSSNGNISALLALCAGIHRSPVNSPQEGQWCGVLMFSLICVWINGWVNNREAGDLRRHHAHYAVTVMMGMMWQFKHYFSSHCGYCVTLQLEPFLLWFIKGFENKQFVTSPCHLQKWKNHILQEYNKITCWCNM